jgi:hypothetical protein
MATKRTRDPRFTKSFGAKPHNGRRYVIDDKVRIEWYEDGKRRSRTIGPNGADTRRAADEKLQEILQGHEPPEPGQPEQEPAGEEAPRTERETAEAIQDTLLGLASNVLDAADWLADGLRNAATELMKRAGEAEEEAEDSAEPK